MNSIFFPIRTGVSAMTLLLGFVFGHASPVALVEEAPVSVTRLGAEHWLVDFGRVAFGNLRFEGVESRETPVVVHFGEAEKAGRVDRRPPGTVRYARAEIPARSGTVIAAPAADARNTKPPAILTPSEWGVVLPFRWVEIEGWPGELSAGQVRRRAAFDASWNDTAAAFRCSDPLLNRIWELCRYSIKATTFAGVFVDGDRERIPYEADAYLNQLSYYACNPDPAMARDTFDYLMRHPTWPTEWAPHMIFMAHADWWHTGDRQWLAARYDALKPKLQLERAGSDGLLTSTAEQIRWGDIVDWPQGERDGFQFTSVNTVVNAFHLRALQQMSVLASAIGREAEARDYRERFAAVRAAFLEKLFDRSRGLFRDGIGTEHASLHANLFPLAFGLVPDEARGTVAAWLSNRGMACSVYAAQYLLEGLGEAGLTEAVLGLMTAEGDRSWKHMVNSGTTITWEAWDQRYKPNQDWNHAWGAAPANLLPRFLLGVEVASPGWSGVRVRPPAETKVDWCEGKVPTPRGPVDVRWSRRDGFRMELRIPVDMTVEMEIPASSDEDGILVDDRPVAAERKGAYWRLKEPLSGPRAIQVRVAHGRIETP